jgi:hypothetical protein
MWSPWEVADLAVGLGVDPAARHEADFAADPNRLATMGVRGTTYPHDIPLRRISFRQNSGKWNRLLNLNCARVTALIRY